jgi:hypothetical protein
MFMLSKKTQTVSTWLPVIEAAADLRERLDGLFFEPRIRQRNLMRGGARASARRLLQSGVYDQDPRKSGRAFRLIGQVSTQFTNVRLRDPARLPEWAIQLRELLSSLETSPSVPGVDTARRRVADSGILFLPLCLPVVRHSVGRLKKGCPRGLLEQLAPIAFRKLQASLAVRLLQILTPATSRHFRPPSESNRVTTLNKAVSPSPTAASQLFELFREFPALARLAATIAADWEKNTRELLERLNRDRRRLKDLVGGRRSFPRKGHGMVADLDSDLSDLHHGGKTVLALHLSTGCSVVYKPRSCRGEKEWGRLLRCLSRPALRPLHPWVLEGDGYGWVEFVRPKRCRSRAEGRLFYQRAGVLLLFAHLTRAVDLHRGNIIAVGSSPVVVDLETLSHPYFCESDFATGMESCPALSRTGLLPVLGDNSRIAAGFHALDSETRNDSVDKHRPQLREYFFPASDFIREIEDGFRSAAIDLYKTREGRKHCARIISRISRQPWRRILRPTAVYTELRQLATDPSLLRDGLTRHMKILEHCVDGDIPLSVAFAEATALGRFDIPFFSGATAARGDRPTVPRLPTLKQVLAAATQIAASW